MYRITAIYTLLYQHIVFLPSLVTSDMLESDLLVAYSYRCNIESAIF